MDYSGSKFRSVVAFLLFCNVVVFASNVTIDAEATVATDIFNSLNSFLLHYNSNTATMPDTVLFKHNDIDTFEMSSYINNRAPSGGILFIGECDNPDSFPVIKHTGQDYYNFLMGKLSFEKIHFIGNTSFKSASTANVVTFRRCVIKDYTQYFISLESSSPVQNLFENCLFVNNKYASGIIKFNSYGAGKKVAFVNCTFDNNARVFNAEATNQDSAIFFRNTIFSGNSTYFTTAKMKSNATFCLTSESSLTGYGEGCQSGSPQFVVATGRVRPSDWKIPSGSPAAKNGIVTGAPTVDIGNRVRLSASNDIGCWIPDPPVKPEITDEPDTVVVNEDSTVFFSVTVTGVELKYSWYKSGSSSSLSDSSKLIIKAASADSGAAYFCVVSNDGGTDSSKIAILNVLKKPVLAKDLSDTIVTVNDSFFLYVKASGSNISYQWYRNGTAIAAAIQDTLTFKSISLDNNGDSIHCVVQNILGTSVSSKKILLTVKDNEGAKIITEPQEYLTATMGDAFSFSTEATGSGQIKYVWYKDGLAASDSVGSGMVFNKTSSVLGDSGMYRCVASNGFGMDTTVAVTVKIMDPSQLRCRLQLTGEFIDREHVKIGIKNLKTITGVIPNPNVNTVFLWCDTSDYPVMKSNSSLQFEIPMSRFTKDQDTFDTLLVLQKLSDNCYFNYFVPVLSWLNPDTTLVGEKANGTAVSSCSQKKIANPIKLECAYVPLSDTVKVNFTNIPVGSARDSIQYLIVRYGNAAIGFVNDTIRKDNFLTGDSAGKLYVNSDFLNDPQAITFSVWLRAILGNVSDTVTKSLTVGIKRPGNSISSHNVDTAYANAVKLAWTLLPTESIDSICIWYGKTQIPLKYNPDTLQYQRVKLGGDERTYRVTSLESGTLYYFAAQIKKDDLWSSITVTSSTSSKTLAPIDTQRIANTIKINGLKFDTTTNMFVVRWTADRSSMESGPVQAAICFSVDKYPEDGPSVGDTIIENVNFNSENVTNIKWDKSKSFGKTYFVSMFLRKENALWSESSEAAKSKILIPFAKWEDIAFFDPDQDSIYVLNRTILVRKGNNWNLTSIVSKDQVLQDTIADSGKGFIIIGTPFRFRNADRTSDIEIGVRYGNIPNGYSSKDLYLYVYKNKGWHVVPRIEVDSESRMVFSSFPYESADFRKNIHVLMLDTVAPEVEIEYDDAPVTAGKEFIYKIVVKDNISNALCSLKCGPIDQSPVSYEVIPLNTPLYSRIHSVRTDDNSNSFRVILRVTDYTHTLSKDLSRTVKVTKNPVSFSDERWVPITTTTILDSSSAEHAFLDLCDGKEWKYDSIRFRIFNWYNDDDGKAGYVQYGKDKADIFDVVPGKVFWMKRRNGKPFDLGAGNTVSIKKPFRIKVPAGQWVDFGIPFQKINVPLIDIFSASGIADEMRDSLWFFRFVDTTLLQFQTVYYPVLGSDQSIADITLKNKQGSAYTVYNASGNNIELIIPPIDVSYSTGKGTLQKKSQNDSWYLKINSQTKDEITVPVYCVFRQNGEGITKLPSPPVPGNLKVGLFDSTDNKTYGTYVFNRSEPGYSVPLYFSNSSRTESKTISYSVTSSKSDCASRCVFYNPENGLLEPVTTSGLSLTLGPRESAYRWALVGDTLYFNSWVKSFVNVRFGVTKISSVAGNILGIEYTVPYIGVSAVKVMVINQLGQCVWSTVNRNLTPGKVNRSSWNQRTSGKLASGAYIIQVSAYNTAQRRLHRVQSRYLHVR